MAASHARSHHHHGSPAERTLHGPHRNVTRWVALLLVAGCGTTDSTEVVDPIPTTMEITVASVQMTFLGENRQLVARVLDQNGNVLSSEVTWLSDNLDVVTVSAAGVATAVAIGSATVTATSGSLSATVPVTVSQVPTLLLVASGNNQEATAGTPLAQPVLVRVLDRGGQAVENITVTFTPDQDNGSVSVTSGTSDPNGEVQTVWTLGTFFGPQRMVAAADGVNAAVNAIARSDVPTPDIAVIAPLTITRSDPSTLESFTARTTVRNDGDLTTGGPNTMRLLADGVEIGSVAIPELAPNAEAMLELQAGPIGAGNHNMSFVADPDNAIVELNETNNGANRFLRVVTQTVVATGANIPVGATMDTELLFRLDLVGTPQNLAIELTGGTGDADLFVDGASRPSRRADYAGCISAGPTTVERCQIALASGSYHIQVHAFSDFSNTRMRITSGGALLPYDVELVFIDRGTAAQDQAFVDAAARWGDIIAGDVPDADFGSDPLESNVCIDGQQEIVEIIDDVRIFVSITSIDGPGGTLARAGPCVTRGLSNLPIVGIVEFDEPDLDRLELDGDMEAVILHEMGHVLGVGTIWGPQWRNLLRNPSLPNRRGADTHFAGQNAIVAFDAAGGAAYSDSKVPVENQANVGSSDGHWRESVLDLELMTPFLTAGQPNPLSAITIESVKDLGYSVDVTEADPFRFTLPAPARVSAGRGTQLMIDLRGDIRTGPVFYVTAKGKVVEVLR